MGITFKLSINNMDLKYTYEYCNLKFTIMAIDHIICFQYLAFKVYVYDCIRFRWGIQIKYLKHAFAWILNMKIVQSTQGIVSNMGCASKSQPIDIQNPKRSPFNNMDLVWKKYVWHGEAHIIKLNVHTSHMHGSQKI